MRTHVEVDPGVGLRGFEGVQALVEEYAWAIDIEICVFPQEGLTNNPGTEELMVAALRDGAEVVGAAPSYDTDHAGQIRRVFELAREYDVDVDMHLDFGNTPDDMDMPLVCELTEKYRLRRPRRDRACDEALDDAARTTARDGAAARRCRRRRHGAAGDRPVPDGPRPGPSTSAAAWSTRTC